MPLLRSPWLALLLAVATSLSAASLPFVQARAVRIFRKDAARWQASFEAADPAMVSKYQGWMKRLEPHIQNLANAPADHPDVKQVREQYAHFQAKVAAASGGAVQIAALAVDAGAKVEPRAAAAPPAAAAPAATVELNYQGKRALQFLVKDLDRYGRTFQGDLDVEKKPEYERSLAALENRWSVIDPRFHAHPDVAAARARVDALKQRVADALGDQQPLTEAEKQAIASFRQGYNRVSYDLEQRLDPISLQVEANRKVARQILTELRAPLDTVANKEHSDFQAEFAKIGPWIAKLEAAEAKSSSMAAEAGDVDGQLALIQQQFPQGKFQAQIPEGANPAELEELGKTFRGWLQGVEAAQAFFEKARALSVKARSPEFQGYAGWFRREVPGDIRRAMAEGLRKWDFHIERAMLNSETSADKLKNAVNPGASMAEWIGNGLGALERKLAWQRGFDGKEDPETRANLETLQERDRKLQGVMQKFLQDTRMPEPSTAQDPELVAIAKELMAEQGFQYRRLRQQSAKHSKREIHFTNGAWQVEDYDQFQIQYAAPKGGDWWITYRAVRFFRKSYRASVTGRWRLGGGFQPRRILEENIER